MAKIKERKEYMTNADKVSMKMLPRTHENCMEKTGRFRPGKTAQDHARKRKDYVGLDE